MSDNNQYILVTPAKNEESNLPKLIESIVKQTIQPSLWVIVDDGSTDDSQKIIRNAINRHPWIESVKLEESTRDVGKHYAKVCNEGFEFIMNRSKEKDIKWSYIGLFDADIVVHEKHVEKLLSEFNRNSLLGIASGCVWNIIDGKEVKAVQREDLPEGGCRLWRKACFEDTGLFDLYYSPDGISTAKAKISGWETRLFPHIKAVSSRPLAKEEGHWKEYKGFGYYNYYVDLHPVFAFLKGLRYLTHYPYYIGIAFMYGYLSSFILRKEKIDDKEIRDYYWKTRPKEMTLGFLRSVGIKK